MARPRRTPDPINAGAPGQPPGYESADIHDLLGEPAAVQDLVQARDATALVKAEQIEYERILREQAELADMKPEAFAFLQKTDPATLADIIAAKSKALHARMVEGDPDLTKTEIETIDFRRGDVVQRVGALSPREAVEMAHALVPEDERGKVQLLWDPPRNDGLVYSYSLVKVAEVQKCLKKGMDVVPHGPLAPKPALRCGIPLQYGGECLKMLRTPMDVELHRRNKHPTTYQMLKESEQREADQEDRQERRAMLGQMQALMQQNLDLQSRLAENDLELAKR